MESIFFNKFGSKLIGSKDATDESEINTSIHSNCGFVYEAGNTMFFCHISEKWNSLICRVCGCSIVFPNYIKTYGELRKFAEEDLKEMFQILQDFQSIRGENGLIKTFHVPKKLW